MKSTSSTNKLGISLFAAIVALSWSSSQATMVAYWDFNSNVNDSVNGNNGTIVGSVPYVAGQFGNATSFSNVNANYITVPSSTSLNNIAGGYTLSIWVNVPTGNTPSTNGDPVSKYFDGTGKGYGLHGASWYSGSASYIGVTAGAYNTAAWSNLVLRWDGSTTLTSYMNGASVASVAMTAASGNASSLVFGNDNRGLFSTMAQPFGGLLDDAALFNAALTVGQTLSIYNVGNSALSYSMTDMNSLFTLYAAAAGTVTTSDGKTWGYNASGLSGSAGQLVGSGPNYSVIFSDTGSAGVSVVPEPATWALLASSLTVVMICRRRRQA